MRQTITQTTNTTNSFVSVKPVVQWRVGEIPLKINCKTSKKK